MNNPPGETFRAALEYLSPVPVDSFWSWADDESVVTWTHGPTIAFREELIAIFERLSETGLPAIDAILLLVAATRAYWPEDGLPLQRKVRSSTTSDKEGQRVAEMWAELFSKLDVVHHLPEDQTRPAEAKAALAMIIFESAPRVANPEVSRMVCAVLKERLVGKNPKLSLSHNRDPLSDHYQNLNPLRDGLNQITASALRLRKETGLDVEPGPAQIDFVVEQQAVRSLLQQLVMDKELSGLSQLARNLAAVIQLPRAILDSDELPLGGVSDLTNRGTLDRLLLSELAHDDLMLATRVALNEALYLRREVQPGYPSERCHVLIDSGLRMWGLPRVFATAVALSLASIRDPETTLCAFRASEEAIIPVDLSTRDGLISHLGALETESQPGRALPELFSKVAQTKLPGDTVLITTERVLDDPEFQQALVERMQSRLYLATVNRDGEFQLWSHSVRGRKCHTSLKLDLNQILDGPSLANRSLVDASVDPDLPAILRVQPFPFRLPGINKQSLSKDRLWSALNSPELMETGGFALSTTIDDRSMAAPPSMQPRSSATYGIFCLSRDQRLVFVDEISRGARQIHESIPYGRCLTTWTSDDFRFTSAALFRESEGRLIVVTVDRVEGTATHHTLPSQDLLHLLNLKSLLGAAHFQGVIYVIFRTKIEAFDATSYQLLAVKRIEERYEWKHGRYFFDSTPLNVKEFAYSKISLDGNEIVSQRVPLGQVPYRSLLFLFDRCGHDGPFAVSTEGKLIDIAGQTESKLWDFVPVKIAVMDISEDGRRLLTTVSRTHASQSELFFVDVESKTTTKLARGTKLAEVDAYQVTEPPHLMRHFASIAVQGDMLVLVSKRGNPWTFASVGDRLVLQEMNRTLVTRLSRDFDWLSRPPNPRLQAVAKWDDGSRVWLDGRGILHLQSSDRTIPEVSLVLSPTHVAIWTSDGHTNGTRYFLDSDNSITVEELVTNIFESFVAQLR